MRDLLAAVVERQETIDEAKNRATCSVCLARTYRGNEDCICEDGGDAEDYDVVLFTMGLCR